MFYDKYLELCRKNGISPSRAATEAGFTKPAVNRWKSGHNPTDISLEKLSKYFGVDKSYFLDDGEAKKSSILDGKQDTAFDDFTFAMHNASRDLTEQDKQLLIDMAARLRKMNQK